MNAQEKMVSNIIVKVQTYVVKVYGGENEAVKVIVMAVKQSASKQTYNQLKLDCLTLSAEELIAKYY